MENLNFVLLFETASGCKKSIIVRNCSDVDATIEGSCIADDNNWELLAVTEIWHTARQAKLIPGFKH